MTLALTIAMLSFIRGTWSFMSRMFCSRMISGFSTLEMKNPTNDRITRTNRLHMGVFLSFPTQLFPLGGAGGAGGDVGEVVIGFSVTK